MIPLFSQKHTKENMLAFFPLEKNEIMLLTYEKMEQERFCFIQEAKYFISWINKYYCNYQIVTSCLE